MGMLTGKEILLLDLYSFQRWPDVRAAFDRFGSYTPSWSAARRQAVADDGDTGWWNAIVDPGRLPDRWIQACLWTIKPEDVFDVRRACGKPDTIGDRG